MCTNPGPQSTSVPFLAEPLLLGETGAAQAEVERVFGECLVIGVLEIGEGGTPLRERVDIRLESNRLGELGPRLVEIATQAKCSRKKQINKPQPGICRGRLSEEIDRLIHMAEKEMRMGKIPIRDADIRIMRIEPYRILDMRDSILWSTEQRQHATEVYLGRHIISVQSHGRFGLGVGFRQSVLQPAEI